MNGNNILIYSDGAVIAGTRSNEVQVETESIEISSPTSGQWREYTTGRSGWSVNVNYLVAAGTDVAALLTTGTTYDIVIVTRSGSTVTQRLQGTAMLKTCRITATRGNLIQGTFSFLGHGELAEVVEVEESE